MSQDDFVKVRFALEQEDGWPPYESEGLWARPLGRDRYALENTPWFVRGASNGDVVRAEADDDGVLWVVEHLEASGWSTVRVIPSGEGRLAHRPDLVLQEFCGDEVSGEAMSQYDLVALEISPTADVGTIKDRLRAGEAASGFSVRPVPGDAVHRAPHRGAW